jgi:hypothetical protein
MEHTLGGRHITEQRIMQLMQLIGFQYFLSLPIKNDL